MSPDDVRWLLSEEGMLAYKHQCPGDGQRGCGVYIPLDRERCHFCTKTIRLRSQGHVIP